MKKEEILKQLFDNDRVVTTVDLGKGSPKVELGTISYEQQLELEAYLTSLKDEDLSGRAVLQKYALKMLSFSITSWGKTKFDHPDQWEMFLQEKPSILIDKLVSEHQKFDKKVREALTLEDIEETFFPKEGPPAESKQ